MLTWLIKVGLIVPATLDTAELLLDGRGSNFAEKKFEKIYTMSGRSFSIISTQTWETVYDPGSLMEETLQANYATIFNSEAEKDKKQVMQNRDHSKNCV